ncbi:MAG: hypothetical protein LC776_00830 [Acidobacteria bacterium]|nr:hypothetical protein [Acidobacteriota bacterium]
MSGELAPLGGSDPRRLPTLAEEGSTTAEDLDPRLSLPRLHRTALHRAAWLADRLADAVAEHGLAALVDDQHALNQAGEVVRVGETIRALAVLEAQERDRAERIATSMARIGLEARPAATEVHAQARRIATVVEHLAKELGHNWAEESTRRAAQRAIRAARDASMG